VLGWAGPLAGALVQLNMAGAALAVALGFLDAKIDASPLALANSLHRISNIPLTLLLCVSNALYAILSYRKRET
jgi:hypothetical protein